MGSYIFQSIKFDTEYEAATAIVVEWLSAGGANDLDTVREILESIEEPTIVAELVDSWRDLPVGWPALETALHDVKARFPYDFEA